MGTKRKVNEAVAEYINNGGKVTVLQFGSEKEIKKAATRFRHRDKAFAGSERSKAILAREQEQESSFIFSKEERWIDEG